MKTNTKTKTNFRNRIAIGTKGASSRNINPSLKADMEDVRCNVICCSCMKPQKYHPDDIDGQPEEENASDQEEKTYNA